MHRITYFRFVHGYFLVQNRLSRGTLRQIQLFPEQEKTVLFISGDTVETKPDQFSSRYL